ncbi:MAG: agmatine/peptidylarginine deiminase [Bradymonadia bacterium]|jgi:agmatine/peptidylarginine deiminase
MSDARRWPAEWEPHAATIVTWPWDASIWKNAHEGAMDALAKAAALLSHGERVIVLAPSEAWVPAVTGRVSAAGGEMTNIEIALIPSNDFWARDHAPTFVRSATGLVGIDWNFNAWGGKFPHDRDARIAAAVCDLLALDTPCVRERATLTLEGGALETNGQGTVLCTRSVCFTDTRNPIREEATATEELKKRLGADKIVWLDAGMSCDDTDGHIDTLARFVDPNTIAVHVTDDPDHPDAATLEANALTLASLGDILRLPAPTIRDERGELLPASYANFYVANSVVLVPAYGHPSLDEQARATLADAFSGRDVHAIDCRALLTQGGAIHCATQQVPATR